MRLLPFIFIQCYFTVVNGWSSEMFWPPSEQSQKFLTAFTVVEIALLILLFRRREASNHAKKVAKTRLENLLEGRKLILDDVKKLDEKVSTLTEQRQEWENGLPEASRVMGYLWDADFAQPTAQLGMPSDPDQVRIGDLFNRALCAEIKKAHALTQKAKQLEQYGNLHDLSSFNTSSDTRQATPAVQEIKNWLEENKTTAREVVDHLSGEKVQQVLDLADDAVDKLGRRILSAGTKDLVVKAKGLCNRMLHQRRTVFRIMFDIACRVAPMWILSNVFFAIQIMGWTEFDRVLFSGEIGLKPLRADGTYDSDLGFRLAKNCLLNCAVWWVSDIVAHALIQKTTSTSTLLLKSRLIECLLFQDYKYFELHSVGKLQALINDDAREVSENMFNLPKEMLGAFIMIFIKLYACFQIAPTSLVLQCLAPIPIVAFINKKMMERGEKEEKKGQKVSEQVSSKTNDVISNIRTVRTFAAEAMEVSRFQGCVDQQSSFVEFANLTQAAAIRFFIFCITASIAWSTYLAGQSVAAGEMKLSDLTVFGINMLHQVHLWQHFFSVVPQFKKMMRPLGRVVNLMKSDSSIESNPNDCSSIHTAINVNSKAELNAVCSKLETVPDDKSSKVSYAFVRTKVAFTMHDETVAVGSRLMSLRIAGHVTQSETISLERLEAVPRFPATLFFSRQHMPSKLVGNIKFDNVKFHYPTDLRKQVLKGLSFEVSPGQKVGICGSAGCGKSTTMDLLQRLYNVDAGSGSIYLDGIDIQQYNVHFLRQRIGVVAQKTVLFKTTVRENIWYGMSSFPGEEAIEAALKQAQAWEFIQEKPDKLLTILTETGGGFSGGQMQRLAIARCLIRKPDIILLDEATAALDPVNERLVQDTLDEVFKGNVTTLAIAHRLTTIKDADKIIMLDQGKVVEEGTHAELMDKVVFRDLDEDGKKVVKFGFYRNQWETQFKETVRDFKENPSNSDNDDYGDFRRQMQVRKVGRFRSSDMEDLLPLPPPILMLAKAATTD